VRGCVQPSVPFPRANDSETFHRDAFWSNVHGLARNELPYLLAVCALLFAVVWLFRKVYFA
jgi:hypothetical protein